MMVFTLTFVTRMKRKVFGAGEIRNEVRRLAEETAKEHGCVLDDIRFNQFSAIFQIRGPDDLEPRKIASAIRLSTSGKIRYEFSELWSMPSLWSTKYMYREGPVTQKVIDDAESFYKEFRSR